MKTRYQITSQAALRESFWEAHPQFAHLFRASKRQNRYPADVRMSFVDYVDSLSRDGSIGESLAQLALNAAAPVQTACQG